MHKSAPLSAVGATLLVAIPKPKQKNAYIVYDPGIGYIRSMLLNGLYVDALHRTETMGNLWVARSNFHSAGFCTT